MSIRAAKRVLAGLALSALTALSACATTSQPPDARLQGQWQLDSAASDDVPARIAEAIRTAQRHRARHSSELGGPPGEGAPDVTGADAGLDAGELTGGGFIIGPDFRELRERLQQTLLSPHTLTLSVQSGVVQIQRDDSPGRDYQPGESITRFEEYGTARLTSAWKDEAFVVSERYTSGARLEERYALDAHGALLYTRSLRDPTVGNIQLRSIYRRTRTAR